MNTAPDTDKQTNLIHKYILNISVQNHGPISANGHGKMTDMLLLSQFRSYKKLSESKVP
jgi:hypothetical protein